VASRTAEIGFKSAGVLYLLFFVFSWSHRRHKHP